MFGSLIIFPNQRNPIRVSKLAVVRKTRATRRVRHRYNRAA